MDIENLSDDEILDHICKTLTYLFMRRKLESYITARFLYKRGYYILRFELEKPDLETIKDKYDKE